VIVTTKYFNQLLASILAEKISSGGFAGPLNGLSLALVSNQLLLTPNNVWTDLTESAFSGYARYANLGWGVPILQPNGTYTILSQLVTFTAVAASAFVQGNVWGWALIDGAAAPNLIAAEQFQQPVPINAPGVGFGLAIEFNVLLPNPASFGQVLA
jgi:hypothetical protein